MCLPELVLFNGDWGEYEDRLYAVYCAEVDNGGLSFKGIPVRFRYAPPTRGKSYAFWHLVSEGHVEEERTPDLRRCERIRWIPWIVNNCEPVNNVVWWKNLRGQNTHVVIWHRSEDYAVVLAERRGYYLFKTAYTVKPSRRQSFAREYAEYMLQNKDRP